MVAAMDHVEDVRDIRQSSQAAGARDLHGEYGLDKVNSGHHRFGRAAVLASSWISGT
jgi:hypothetical protein